MTILTTMILHMRAKRVVNPVTGITMIIMDMGLRGIIVTSMMMHIMVIRASMMMHIMVIRAIRFMPVIKIVYRKLYKWKDCSECKVQTLNR